MTQEVTYNVLLIAQRKVLHRRAGEAIETLFPDRLAEQAATLAYHFEKAGVHDKAFTYLVQTAGRAARVYANQEAVTYYLRALAVAREAGCSPADLTNVHEGLGDVYYLMSDYQPAWSNTTRPWSTWKTLNTWWPCTGNGGRCARSGGDTMR